MSAVFSLPASHNECVKIVEMASRHNVVLIPFGGGLVCSGE